MGAHGGDADTLTNLNLSQYPGGQQELQTLAMEIKEHERDLEDNISSYTVAYNEEVKKNMQLTDQYFKVEEERLHRFNYYKGIDCRKMMKEFAVECNTLNYHLKRLVADKDSHQVLAPRRTETIDVIPDTYMYFKVNTRDMQAPGKLHFGYGEGQYVRSGAPKRMGTM